MLLSSWKVSPTCLDMLAGNLFKPPLTISQDMTTFCWLKKVEPILGSSGAAGFSSTTHFLSVGSFTFCLSIDRFSGNQLLSFTRRLVSVVH